MSVSKKTYCSRNQLYNLSWQPAQNSISSLHTSQQKSQRPFSFYPVSSLSNTYCIWNVLILLLLGWETSLKWVQWPLNAWSICLSKNHRHILWCCHWLSFLLPTYDCMVGILSWNQTWGLCWVTFHWLMLLPISWASWTWVHKLKWKNTVWNFQVLHL